MAAGSAATRDTVLGDLCSLLGEVSEGKLAPGDIETSADMFDYGYLDSLSGVLFLALVEERWGVHIEDVDLVQRLNTLDAVAAHLCASP